MKTQETEQKREKRIAAIIIILLSLITISSLLVTVWALCLRPDKQPLVPDYALPEEDKNAVDAIGGNDQKLEYSQGGGAVGFEYSEAAYINLQTGKIDMFFKNPHRSSGDIVLQIVIQDTVIAQSGRLVPGKQISVMELLKGKAEILAPGGYNAKFIAIMYNSETGERAMIESELTLLVTVPNN